MKNSNSTTSRVLIVDDHKATVECLSIFLSLSGFECRAAFDGASALEIAREFSPNVVLLDLCLPQMDGFELARSLRKLPFSSELVLIVLSGLDFEDSKGRCAMVGINHLLKKPASLELIENLIGALRYRID